MTATILVADDELFIVNLVAALLEDEGYTVLHARDGAEALALAVTERPDLILADVMMPRLTDIELAQRLRAIEGGAGPPIILLSAVHEPRDLPEHTVFVPKPFDMEHLAALVARLLA